MTEKNRREEVTQGSRSARDLQGKRMMIECVGRTEVLANFGLVPVKYREVGLWRFGS